MKRREFLVAGGASLGLSALSVAALARRAARPASGAVRPLTPPANGPIRVAVAISEGVTVIDFAGPWEVFQDVILPGKDDMAFALYTVAATKDVVEGSGGLKIVPEHTFASAPEPRIVVVPAQRGSPELHAWLRKMATSADVVASVCTGAFQLAKAGLLSGKRATTHHEFIDRLAKGFPDVKVEKAVRFVENERISTAGGLSSGIDLALHVVERYFGRPVAERTAAYMEYQGKGWVV